MEVEIDRHLFVGGSDVPIIMGLSPFKSRYELLLEKAELVNNEFFGNIWTDYGNVLEPKIRDYWNSKWDGKPFIEVQKILGNYRYNADGFDGTSILEIKTTSQIKKTIKGYKSYVVQLLFGMMINEVKQGILLIYERPKDFNEEFDKNRLQEFLIKIDDYKELCDEINLEVEKFLKDLEKVKANPLISEEELYAI